MTNIKVLTENQLTEIRFNTNRASINANQLAQMILDDSDVKNYRDPYWIESVANFIRTVILYKLAKELYLGNPIPSLSDVALEISNPQKTIKNLFTDMISFDKYDDKNIQLIVQSSTRSLLNRDEQELANVISTATRRLEIYLDLLIKHHTSSND